MINNKFLAPIYFIAFIACFIVFFAKHQWGWLTAAGAWLAIAIYSYIKYNKNDNDISNRR